MCDHHPYLVPRRFHHPEENPAPIKQAHPISPCPQPVATTSLLFVSMDSSVLGISCNGIRQYFFALWCVTYSLSVVFLRFTDATACVSAPFLLRDRQSLLSMPILMDVQVSPPSGSCERCCSLLSALRVQMLRATRLAIGYAFHCLWHPRGACTTL